MFDLPNITEQEKREYRLFRKYLIKSGFIMEQESVYSKLAMNLSIVMSIKDNLRKNKPKYGLVQMLTLTENQYQHIEYLVGECGSEVISSSERLVIL